MSEYDKEEAASMLEYFWNDKGDIERWVGFDKFHKEIERDFPDFLDAWKLYKRYERMLGILSKHLGD